MTNPVLSSLVRDIEKMWATANGPAQMLPCLTLFSNDIAGAGVSLAAGCRFGISDRMIQLSRNTAPNATRAHPRDGMILVYQAGCMAPVFV
jgi:hypothetical protein